MRRTVSQHGLPVKLGNRAFDLLVTLAAQPGRVFSPQELMQRVWPGRVVEEANLRVQINALRQRLGAAQIVNLAGRGYVYVGLADTPTLLPRCARLPRNSAPLLGREVELAALAGLLSAHRLVTVLGPVGVGKSQLALVAAQQALQRWPDRVWWVDLTALAPGGQSAQAIAWAVARAVGLAQGDDAALWAVPGGAPEGDPVGSPQAGAAGGASAGGLVQQLARWLGGSEGLVVLDNAEHLAAPLALLAAALLQQAPRLRLLITTQQSLQLADAQAVWLAPLAPPALGATAAQARSNAALQLLQRQAQAADHQFSFSDADLCAAAALCRRLDGLPLALVMAGAWLPVLGLAALNDRLDDRLRWLGLELGNSAARHASLQDAMAWSCARLTADQATVLQRLSVFAGAFQLDSGLQVASVGPLDPTAVWQAMLALAEQSLLQRLADPGNTGKPRYRLLECTRLWAAQALDNKSETDAIRARHARAMATRAEAALTTAWQQPDRVWLAQWAGDWGDWGDGGGDGSAVELTDGLPNRDDWLLGLDHACAAGDAESAGALGEALSHRAALTGQFAALRQRLLALMGLLHPAPPVPLPGARAAAGALARARLCNLCRLGPLSVRAPGMPNVLSPLQAAHQRIAAWRAVDDASALARALADAALTGQQAGDPAAADAWLAEALALTGPAASARQQLAAGLTAACAIAAWRGNSAGLRDAALALQIAARIAGADRVMAQAPAWLATAAMLDGDHRQALQLQHDAVDRYRALRNGSGRDLGIAMARLCTALLHNGQTSSACDAARQAVHLLGTEAMDHDTALHQLAQPLAELAWRLHRPLDAARLLGAADALYRRRGTVRAALQSRGAEWLLSQLLASPDAAACQAALAARQDEQTKSPAGYGLPAATLAWLSLER